MSGKRGAIVSLAAVGAALLATAAGGCQVIFEVDRNLIPGPDAGAVGGGGGGVGGGGAGGAGPECITLGDCQDKGTTCHPGVCEASKCGFKDADEGTACTENNGNVCDGKGGCVECTKDKHCTGDDLCDTEHNKCVPPPCKNGVLDGDETDKDCGGMDCAPCTNGKKCEKYSDCESGFCPEPGGGEGGAGGGGGEEPTPLQCAVCGDHADCQDADYCNADGKCVVKLLNGASCKDFGTAQCDSGFCANDFCCDKACDGGCGACAKDKGAEKDGKCTAVKKDTECRAKAGDCDVAEACTGDKAACPADAVAKNDVVCRAVAGGCDLEEKCDGSLKTCPADAFKANDVVCRAVAGDCDLEEKCPGNAAACPADAFKPKDTECRAKAGDCDVAEACTG
ncbi:MAG: hypothetical protein HY744_33660, partial [Deltaproteobacteria bacterium]|nr:hypothetical protein [Deltaproteobacteria bacterium]